MKWKKKCSKPPTSYDIPFKMVIYKSLLNPMKKPYLKNITQTEIPNGGFTGKFPESDLFSCEHQERSQN